MSDDKKQVIGSITDYTFFDYGRVDRVAPGGLVYVTTVSPAYTLAVPASNVVVQSATSTATTPYSGQPLGQLGIKPGATVTIGVHAAAGGGDNTSPFSAGSGGYGVGSSAGVAGGGAGGSGGGYSSGAPRGADAAASGAGTGGAGSGTGGGVAEKYHDVAGTAGGGGTLVLLVRASPRPDSLFASTVGHAIDWIRRQ